MVKAMAEAMIIAIAMMITTMRMMGMITMIKLVIITI